MNDPTPPATQETPPQAAPEASTDASGESEKGWEQRDPGTYSRFQKVNEQKKQLQFEMARLTKQVELFAAEKAQLSAMVQEKENLAKEYQETLRLAKVHPSLLDDEAQQIAKTYHARLDPQGRPSLADWVAEKLAAGDIPKGLSAWLSPSAGGAPSPFAPPKTAAVGVNDSAKVVAGADGAGPTTLTQEMLDRETDPKKKQALLDFHFRKLQAGKGNLTP